MASTSLMTEVRSTARALATIALGMVIGFALASGVLAAGETSGGSARANPRGSAGTAGDQPAQVDKPMSGEMKKKGMMQGDVKKAARKWDRKMKDMMENEAQQRGAVK